MVNVLEVISLTAEKISKIKNLGKEIMEEVEKKIILMYKELAEMDASYDDTMKNPR